MTTPNLFLIYVTDVQRATSFYNDLFGMQPKLVTPRYVPYEVAPGVLFALWSGRQDQITDAPRTCEVGLMLPGGAAEIDALYQTWVAKGVTVHQEPYDDVFGRTFMITDPDQNLIRVSPRDRD
ncbi:MAG: VOC family protein [Microlunatus sp.]|nr:VOC family protein [Microlunatus sp.]